MSNTTTFKFLLDDGGTSKETLKIFKQINAEADKLSKSTSLFSKGMGRGVVAAAARYKGGSSEGEEYGVARGAIGTGAQGRDFAKQAQGLGGLVHVYATFAANLFAVSAAFKALSDAADTSNMVKGLDQLGVSSGVNLAKMSKSLVETTDGAISLREAMTATAQASAAGMSDTNIKRLGAAARGASVALGVSMSDAIGRLSRGITKLEPELLDELGIFVRVDKASEDYARTIGKNASALTDFEKRQAFANAVLDQAKKKFGDIDIPANPYDKLLASLKNVAQTGLEIVNKVLGPIALALANSPTGLGLAIAGVAAVLLKQALPAITQFRAGLHAAQQEAAEVAASHRKEFAEYEKFTAETAKNSLSTNAKKLESAALSAVDNVNKIFDKGLKIGKGKIYEILSKNIQDISPADIDKISKQAKVFEGVSKSTKASVTDAAKSQAKEKADELTNLIPLIQKAQEAQKAFNLTVEAESKGIAKTSMHGKMLADIEKAANRAAKSSEIVAQSYDDAKLIGMTKSWAILTSRVALAKDELGKFGAAATLVKGSFAVLAAGIGTVLSAFSNILGVVGLVTSAITLLVSWLGKNDKEAAQASQSLTDLGDASQFLGKVLDNIAKKDPLEQLSLQSIAARANAMAGLGASMVQAFEDVNKEIEARNPIDKFTNAIFGIFGKSTEDKLSKELATSVSTAVDAARKTVGGEKLVLDIAKLLGISADAPLKAFAEKTKDADKSLQGLLAKDVDKFGKEMNTSAQSAKSLENSFTELYKQYDDITKATAGESKLTLVSVDSVKLLYDLSKTLKGDLEPALASVVKYTSDPKFLQLMPRDQIDNLLEAGTRTKALTAELANLNKQQEQARKEADIFREQATPASMQKLSADQPGLSQVKLDQIQKDYIQAAKTAEERIGGIKIKIVGVKSEFDKVAADLSQSLSKATEKQIDIIFQEMSNAAAKAQIGIKKGYLESFQGTDVGAKLSGKYTQDLIDLEIKSLNQTKDLISALTENTLAVEKGNAQKSMADLIEKQKQYKVGSPEYSATQGDINKEATRISKIDTTTKAIRGGLSKEQLKDLNTTDPELANKLIPLTSRMSGTIAAIAIKSGEKVQAAFKTESELMANQQARMTTFMTNSIADLDRQLELNKAIADPAEQKTINAALLAERDAQLKELKTLPEKYKTLAAERVESKLPEAKGLVAETEKLYNIKAAEVDKEIEQAAVIRDRDTSIAELNFKYATTKELSDKLNESYSNTLESEKTQNTYAQERLDILNQQGLLAADSYTTSKNKLVLDSLAVQDAQELLTYTKQRLDTENKLALDIATARNRGDTTEVDRLTAYGKVVETVSNAEYGYIIRNQEARRAGAEAIQYMSGRHEAYTKVFEQGFKSMEDAIVEFTKTGKLSFDSMISSMLEGLLRYELEQQRIAMFSSLGGAKGITGSLLGLFGATGSSGGSGNTLTSDQGALDYYMNKNAKGGAYSGGVQAFAQGGMFTNSIVNSPTLFKFAHGTGLMGEAGPEAIMPLKRDSSGNLGVRTNQQAPNVEVVVNNHSGQPATARESTDARGNRKIEVIVGDMVASEMSRPGSSAQSSVRNNFGIQPALVRR